MTYLRTIHFADTDAAGVVYFARLLSICHEAYEASIAASGVNLTQFFRDPQSAVPIVSANIDFFQPLFCGEMISVRLSTRSRSDNEFEVVYQIYRGEGDRPVSRATTRHVCIHPQSRQRQPLSPVLASWVKENSR